MKQVIVLKGNSKKVNLTAYSHHKDPGGQMEKLLAPGRAAPSTLGDELTELRAVAAAVQKIRRGAQRELELAKQVRAEAQRYQQETEIKARSQAQQLILRTRLATRKEIEELIGKASAEIQKVLVDIRVIRITAQEELAAQRKFTNASRRCSLKLALQEETGKPEKKRKKQLAFKK